MKSLAGAASGIRSDVGAGLASRCYESETSGLACDTRSSASFFFRYSDFIPSN